MYFPCWYKEQIDLKKDEELRRTKECIQHLESQEQEMSAYT